MGMHRRLSQESHQERAQESKTVGYAPTQTNLGRGARIGELLFFLMVNAKADWLMRFI